VLLTDFVAAGLAATSAGRVFVWGTVFSVDMFSKEKS